jgi:hypothetical protein
MRLGKDGVDGKQEGQKEKGKRKSNGERSESVYFVDARCSVSTEIGAMRKSNCRCEEMNEYDENKKEFS